MCSNQETATDMAEIIDHPGCVIIEGERQAVRCLCPKCGINHILKIFWTGTVTPRKYCHKCREVISSVNDQNIYEIAPDVFRIHRGVTVRSNDG